MASPFHVFRKNQKIIIAVAGVLIIVGWVIGDALTSAVGGGSGPSNSDVVATFRGGQITEAELSDLVARRLALRRFLVSVANEGRILAPDKPFNVVSIIPLPLDGRRLQEDRSIEEVTLQTEMFARAAERDGISISDDAISAYIRELGHQKVDNIHEILENTRLKGSAITSAFVKTEIRRAMLAILYQRKSLDTAVGDVAFGDTPEAQWTDWKKVKDYIKLETVAYPAADYMAEVKEPSDSELKKFFKKYKNEVPRPDVTVANYGKRLASPLPAFKTPRKIKIQYLVLDYDTILASISDKVTDEEIKKHYEEFKKIYYQKDDLDIQSIDGIDTIPTVDAPAAETKEEKTADKTSTEKPKEDKATEPKKESSEKKSKPSKETVEEKPVVEEKPEEKKAVEPSEEKAAVEIPEAKKTEADKSETKKTVEPKETVEPKKEDESAAIQQRKSKFKLASFLQDEEDKDSEKTASEKESDEAKVIEDKPEPTDKPKATEDKPKKFEADKKTADEKTTVKEDKPAEDKKVESSEATPKEVKIEYKPLDEVREEIRERIASDQVLARQLEITQEIQAKLKTIYSKYQGKLLDLNDEQQAKYPAPKYPLQELADKYGIRLVTSSEVSFEEFPEIDQIGESSVSYGEGFVPLQSFLFSPDTLYAPFSADKDVAGLENRFNRYHMFSVIKVKDTPENVPAFKDVKDEVIKAWKMKKASKLAFETAKSKAKSLKDSKKTLLDDLAGDEKLRVEETGDFAWLTIPIAESSGSWLSDVYSIEEVDSSFMEKAFAMKDGERKAMLNHDGSVTYLVRMIGHAKLQKVLRKEFLTEVNRWQGRTQLMSLRRNIVSRDVYDKMLNDELQFKKLRPLDQRNN